MTQAIYYCAVCMQCILHSVYLTILSSSELELLTSVRSLGSETEPLWFAADRGVGAVHGDALWQPAVEAPSAPG